MISLFDNFAGRLGFARTVTVAPAQPDPLADLRAEHDRIFAERRSARADRRRAAEDAAAVARSRRKPDPIMGSRIDASEGPQA